MKNKKEEIKKIRVRNSRKLYIPVYLMIIILVVVLVYLKFSKKIINPVAVKLVLIFGVGSLVATEIHRVYNVYEINEDSLVHARGYFTKKSRKMNFCAISDLFVIQNIWQRLLSYGNVEVSLFSGESSIHIKNIDNPHKFAGIILKRINKEMKGE